MSTKKETPVLLEQSELDEKAVIAKHIDLEQDPTDTPEWRAKERKIVTRLDMTLMPMVWILYLFNYLDRNNIASVHHPSGTDNH
jgi:hypothetical protein